MEHLPELTFLGRLNHCLANNMPDNNKYKKFNYEKCRLESFWFWPVPYVNVQTLAKNGFYFVKEDAKVMCQFCNLLIGDWPADKTIEQIHQSNAPYCPYIKGEQTDNVPLLPNQSQWRS